MHRARENNRSKKNRAKQCFVGFISLGRQGKFHIAKWFLFFCGIDIFPCLRAHQAPDGGYKSFCFLRMREQDSTRHRTKIIKFAKIALTKSLLYWVLIWNSSCQRYRRANSNLFKTEIVCQLQAWQTLISPPTFRLLLLNLLSTVAQNFQINRLTKRWGGVERVVLRGHYHQVTHQLSSPIGGWQLVRYFIIINQSGWMMITLIVRFSDLCLRRCSRHRK